MDQERFVCVWLDDDDDGNNQLKEFEHIKNDLRYIIDFFRKFNDFNQCINFIYNINNTKVLLITFNSYAKRILPIIHSCEQLHSIYIFDLNILNLQKWTNKYEKIQGIFNNINIICEKIKEILIKNKSKQIDISFISSNDIHSNDINRQDPSFMYFQLLKECILNDDDQEIEENNKEEMLNFCQKIYSDDDDTLKILNEFKENFLPDLSIYWYTRECFLYRMLNKALRSPQPDILYKLRYFLRHLHQQIISQAKMQKFSRESIIVYRGQNVTKDKINKFKKNIGGFLSFNSFLSTSTVRNVALKFLAGPNKGVLFEMFIDTNNKRFPFAQIEHLSFQQGPNQENEVLFSMGTVFRIIGMDMEDDFYRVQLMLSNDIDQQLDEYTQTTRAETLATHSFLSLIKVMYELKQYDYIDNFIQIFNDDILLSNDPDIVDVIHNTFGLIYHDRGQLKEASQHLQKSLDIRLISLSADHPKISHAYNNLGLVYSAQSDYETALTYYQLALDCQTNSENPNILSIITYTSNIAYVYNYQENYSESLKYHKRVLELKKEYLGDNDPSLTSTYNAISTICYKMNDYEQTASYHDKAKALQENNDQTDPESSANCSITSGRFCVSQQQYDEALQHFNHALQIQQQYFLPNNPTFAITYDCIANTYYKQELYEQALSNHIKGLEIEQKSFTSNHPTMATSYYNISKDYLALLRWSDALEYAFKAIEQINKSNQADVDTLILYNNHIGDIYQQYDQFENALKYYNKALDLAQTYKSNDDASLTVNYYKIATIYEKLEKYEQALLFYEKTLEIELKTLPDDAKTIATTYSRMSVVYINLKRFDDALNTSEKGLNQLLKTLPYNHPEVVDMREGLDYLKMILIIKEDYQ